MSLNTSLIDLDGDRPKSTATVSTSLPPPASTHAPALVPPFHTEPLGGAGRVNTAAPTAGVDIQVWE